MKKKFKDITMGEFSEICENHNCEDCPFTAFPYCDFILYIKEDDLKEEYDL